MGKALECDKKKAKDSIIPGKLLKEGGMNPKKSCLFRIEEGLGYLPPRIGR